MGFASRSLKLLRNSSRKDIHCPCKSSIKLLRASIKEAFAIACARSLSFSVGSRESIAENESPLPVGGHPQDWRIMSLGETTTREARLLGLWTWPSSVTTD